MVICGWLRTKLTNVHLLALMRDAVTSPNCCRRSQMKIDNLPPLTSRPFVRDRRSRASTRQNRLTMWIRRWYNRRYIICGGSSLCENINMLKRCRDRRLTGNLRTVQIIMFPSLQLTLETFFSVRVVEPWNDLKAHIIDWL